MTARSMRVVIVLVLLSFHIGGASWVDPDTPEYYKTTTSMFRADKRDYELVGSEMHWRPLAHMSILA